MKILIAHLCIVFTSDKQTDFHVMSTLYRIGSCCSSRTYPIQCGQYIQCVIQMEKNVKLMEKKFFALKQNSQSVSCMFFKKCVLYMAYAKEWPYYSKKNEQIHIMTLSFYSNKSIFFKAGCVRSKHEKHSQDSRENFRVRTI